MQTDIDPRDLIGHKAVDRNGDKIGTVDEVYLDDATGEPEWAAVRTGIFGRDAFVPLATSEFSGDELHVPYDKSLIKESPDFGVGQHLSPEQELELYRYYGLNTSGDEEPSVRFIAEPAPEPAPKVHSEQVADRDFGEVASSPGPVQGPAPAPLGFTRPDPIPERPAARPVEPPAARADRQKALEITCREERLDITTQWHNTGTTRLRKYVTTEVVERRVPVVRERVRVERIPVSDAEREALSDQEIAEAMEEVTLREERPVVRKYLVPVERVRLVVERYTEEQVIREELRREQVQVHGATDGADVIADGAAAQQQPPWNAQPSSPATSPV
ncbi:PRC and DUF2382 domain-containing protein [Kitasatospora griseola]|uniref:PRC and DUF2382 domain-containing protein n=1 Tax=Kitasatospora griseola TaxID=2064 RepID=UPI0016700446|nr:PRC and DUF2382 domain-containing protein [Kitasatospora griseola]GGQ76260.1 hypothetical protein GCM10010195_34860 [Kitasatospora griseola]